MLTILLLFQALVLVGASEHTYFVKPNNLSANCPSQEHLCLTIDEYASNQSEFFTSNSIFLFLPGTHSTRTVIHLANISNIQLKGFNSSPKSCETDFVIDSSHVSNMTIQGLTLRLTGRNVSNILALSYSSDILVTSSIVQGIVQYQGSAVVLDHSMAKFVSCTFKDNMAVHLGGALLVREGSKVFISNCLFSNNSAKQGGGTVYVDQSEIWISESNFTSNIAQEAGGIFCSRSRLFTSSVRFVSNSATVGTGGAVLCSNSKAEFSNLTVTGNSGTALFFYHSSANFTGVSILKKNNNTGIGVGGALTAEVSTLSFFGYTVFQDNYAYVEGGALACLVQTTISFAGTTEFIGNIAYLEGGGAVLLAVHAKLEMHGSVLFKNNNCTTCYGGAISVTESSAVEIFNYVKFISNSGQMGGAIYVRTSTIVMAQGARMESIGNYAESFGGGIFHMDNIDYYQCNFTMNANYPPGEVLIALPDCFLKFKNFSFANASNYQILSTNDTAGSDGSFMYGGLIDKCHIVDTHEGQVESKLLYEVIFEILQIQPSIEHGNQHTISSEAFTLCFCENDIAFNCTGSVRLSALRGSRFNVSVLALSQGNATTAPVILAKVRKTARLKLDQYSQHIAASCSTLSYNMYSTDENEQLIIYPDKTCRDTGLAMAIVNITFLPCPTGFIKSGDQCVCEERLQKFTDHCIVGDDENYIARKTGSKYWIGYSNDSTLGVGLILCRVCPAEYCESDNVNVSLKNLDIQCTFNHSSLLCGACAKNYSRIFGDSRCRECSDRSTLLLIAFTGAGIFLVVFLSVLRLTVATGMINSIILYANIVQANKNLFFPNTTNVLTVFIAWMNLDLGIPTCFYDGMDAYAQTWLQFVFPLYVWFIISLIIITSRYSTLVTKLIGSNPIAVLATLLLMSYTKILKNTIEIYLSVNLEYPDTNITVWFKDGNVEYFKSRHLILVVFVTLFFVVFFLPYMFLLLLGYKMYGYSGNRLIRQLIRKVKPLLDSYYAPHESRARFWPGLLLLVRCGLFIVFSLDFLHRSTYCLLAINITFSSLFAIAWFSIRVYERFLVNAIEALVFLNLIALSAAISNDFESQALILSLVGMVFALMMGVILYQFYSLFIAKSSLWLNFTSFLPSLKLKRHRDAHADTENERTPLIFGSSRVISLREPLLEEN